MSDDGEAKARKRFGQSPRVCTYGCPGLCTPKCVAAGECIVFESDTPARPCPFVDLESEEGRITAALAGIGAAVVGSLGIHCNLVSIFGGDGQAVRELPILCHQFRRVWDPEKVKATLATIVEAEMERQRKVRES